MANMARKNPFTTGTPKTGTARSQRAGATGALFMVAVLIVVLSIQSLFRVRGLPPHDLSSSCESPAPGRHTAAQAKQSIDRAVSASAGFWPALSPARAQAGQVFQRRRGKDKEIAFRRCQFLRTRDPGSSGRDFS